MSESSPLAGRRVLVVEDNFVLAESMRFALEGLGCVLVGPAPNCERALALIEGEDPECAVLDIDLQGKSSAPIAERLVERGTPFVFLTGYEDASLLPEVFHSWTRLSKPVDPDELVRILADKLESAG